MYVYYISTTLDLRFAANLTLNREITYKTITAVRHWWTAGRNLLVLKPPLGCGGMGVSSGPIIFSPFIQGMLALLKMAELARMCTLAFSMEYPSFSQATCVYANTVLLERRDCFSVQRVKERMHLELGLGQTISATGSAGVFQGQTEVAFIFLRQIFMTQGTKSYWHRWSGFKSQTPVSCRRLLS